MLFLIPTFVMMLLCAAATAWYVLPGRPRPVATTGRLSPHTLAQRRYHVYCPASLAPGAGLLLVLHGSGQTAEKARRASGYRFEQLADERGFLLVYPEAYQGHWNDARQALPVAARREQIDDSAFVQQLIAHLVQAHGVDPKRVSVFGHGGGGQMALRLAVEIPEHLAGVCASGATLPAAGNDVAAHRRRAVPVLLAHGSLDPASPYEGGTQSLFGLASRGQVLSARATAAHFAELAQARAQSPEAIPAATGARTQLIVHRWTVAAGTRVALYEVRGGGHVLAQPNGRAPRILGLKAEGLDITQVACEFFVL